MVAYVRSIAVFTLSLAGALFLISCGDNGTDPDPEPEPTTGSIRVTVNAGGSGQSGVTVHRYAPGSNTPAASQATGGDGTTTFASLEPGDWDIGIELPDGFELDEGEAERKTATVVAGQTANTTFALVDTFDGELIMASDNLTFSQASLTISVGTSVRWVNEGAMLHTVTPDGHSEWSEASLSNTGDIFTHTFDNAGTFDYYCSPHQGQGMTGTVIVQQP